ncbi:MAG TPA: flagellar filament capping protein FliD, partial [Acidimicrobiia bacterium]|nr:flagellar filament capping protein FliD [Acidimicrobiia bacterium]
MSGLDTTTIITQLMSLERQPQNRLKTLKTSISNQISVYQSLNSKFSTLASKAQDLARVAGWKAMKATASSTAVTATATSSASSGQLSFTVQQLARAGAVASTGTVASTAAVVADGPVVLSRGADALGFSGLGAGAGLTAGTHTITVTRATTGAGHTGTAALAATTSFAAPATLDVTVDGVAKSYNIAAGSYTPAELAAAVATASGGELTASVGDDGALTVTTAHEGSTASLAITGGTAAASLFLATGGPAATGTDGQLTVDGGPVVTVTSAGAAVTSSLTGPNGTISAAFASGLRTGTATVVNVDPGGGSLSALVDAINATGAGISAAAVKVGTSGYRLQISSTTTGAGSNISVDTTNLSGGVSEFATVQAGRDALIRIGEGAGAYDVTSSTDTITDLLPGVSVQLNSADPATTVTVTVAQDGNALADKVAALVDAANGALSTIATNSTYDPETRKAGVLLADGNARRLADQVLNAISSAVGSSSLGSAGAVGISLVKDGTVSFDKAKFLAAYAADPAAVAALFQEGGTATDSHVTYLAASDKTRAGTYAVDITTPAAQALATGTALSGAGLLAAETIEVRVGGVTGTTATYAASAGESLESVADGLNAVFAQQSLGLSASVQSGRLVLRSSAYGSLARFEVRSSALGAAGEQTGLVAASGTWEPHTGTDVAGTINGVTATGNGQALIAPATDATLGGLALTITATMAGALGTFTYVPGVAARLDAAASDAINFGTGAITTAISGRQQRITEIDGRIADWDVRLAARERTMRRQFAAMETALGNLRNQSN